MIFTHLQVALRHLTKNKGLNAIHITGLAIGISVFFCCMFKKNGVTTGTMIMLKIFTG